MKITSFDIHEFGLLEKQSHSLEEGVCIFLGKNEAGKSTALEFFRTLLTGFPFARTKKGKEGLFANKSKQMGGILEIESTYAGFLKIERKATLFQVFNKEGLLLSHKVYEHLLSNVTRDIYSALYGFSLTELQTLQSLEDEEVQAVLYGASSALHAFSPQKALTQIDNRLLAKGNKSLVANESFKNFFKANCTRIEQINAEIKNLIAQNKEIDTFYAEIEEKAHLISELRTNKSHKQEELQLLQRKIQAWQIYSEWHMLLQKIQRIPESAKNFPLKALETLHILEQKISTTKEEIEEKSQEKRNLQASIEKKILNTELLKKQTEISRLTEFKSSYRNALNAMPLLEKKAKDMEKELSTQLAYLGNEWNREKIEKLDFSIQNQEKIENFGKKIDALLQEMKAEEQAIYYLNQEIHSVENEIHLFQEKNSALPSKELNIQEYEYTKLEEYYTRALYSDTFSQKKRADLNKCTQEFEDALKNYSFDFELSEATINTLLESQHKASVIAKSMQMQEEKKSIEEHNIQQIEKALIKHEKRNTELLNERYNLNAKEIEDIRQEERQLNLLQDCVKEQARLREIFKAEQENMLKHTATQAFSIKRTLLSLCLFIMASLCFALFYSSAFLSYSSLPTDFLTQNATLINILPFLGEIPHFIEISTSLCFVLFLLSFAFFLYLLPMINPNIRNAKKSLEESHKKLSTMKKNLHTLNEKKLALYSFFAIEKLNEDFFDIRRNAINKEVEKSQKSFLLKEKIDEITREIDTLEEEKEKSKEFLHAIQESFVRSQRQWEELFTPFAFTSFPKAENMHRDFARLEQIKLSLQAKKNIEEELISLEAEITKLSQLIATLFPHLSIHSDKSTLLEKTKEILLKYSEEEKIQQARNNLKEQIDIQAEKKEVLLLELIQKQQALARIKEEKNQEEILYYSYLKQKNFDEMLPAVQVKSRMTQAEKCLQLYKQLETLKYEIEKNQEEIERFSKPLAEIFYELGNVYKIQADELIQNFDTLLKQAQDENALMQEKQREEQQLAQYEELLLQKNNEIQNLNKDVQNIFSSVSLNNKEDFEKQAHYAAEFAEHTKQLQHIEDKLQFLARDKDLKDFIQEFEGIELAYLQSSSVQLEQEVRDIQEKEDEECTNHARIKAHIGMLENSSQLSELRQEKSILEEKNAHALDTYMTYTLAQSFIKKTKAEYEKEKQPELIKKASEIFSFITDGKWQNIVSSLEDNSLTINPAKGSPLSPDKLSQGTKEQLYLSLRLAYILLASQYKESLPILMDDIFVNFDEQRAKQSAKTLNKIVEDNKNQQILFFTCHEHIARILKENITCSTLYTIEKGLIRV